jgi:beta-N-acetylhexosaminidase
MSTPACRRCLVTVLLALVLAAASQSPEERWVDRTLRRMTVDEKVAQLLVPSVNGVFASTDSASFEEWRRLVRERKVGGIHVFGGSEAFPSVLLNPSYGTGGSRSRKSQPLETAALLNRLQRESDVPLLVTADFEGGVGFQVEGGTRLPRAMAMGATRDADLVFRAGELAAREGRSLGVHVNFYPVVDVNNNPRNPIINLRSFGEDPALVSEMARAYVRGAHAGGMLATAKHFPGHGDTAVDTHIDLPTIDQPRSRLDAVELPPFKAAIAEGVDAVMSSHIVLPALDPTPGIPATLSRPILTGLLREELGFDGLVFTDALEMQAIRSHFTSGEAAARAVRAGADLLLVPPDPEAAFRGIRDAVERGEIARDDLDRSVRRILRAKARLGLARQREVDLMAIASELGGRHRARTSLEIASRAITLLKDDRSTLPLTLPSTARVLYVSLVDYASGWREGAPARTLVPELRKRFPEATAIEVSDRTSAAELDLVRALGRDAELVIVATFVRIAAYSGRIDLLPAQTALLEDLAASPSRPTVALVFGNPYLGLLAPKVPAVLLTYEFGDATEEAAVRALFGEAPIGGKLPISLPELYAIGHGLVRPARSVR